MFQGPGFPEAIFEFFTAGSPRTQSKTEVVLTNSGDNIHRVFQKNNGNQTIET